MRLMLRGCYVVMVILDIVIYGKKEFVSFVDIVDC